MSVLRVSAGAMQCISPSCVTNRPHHSHPTPLHPTFLIRNWVSHRNIFVKSMDVSGWGKYAICVGFVSGGVLGLCVSVYTSAGFLVVFGGYALG